MHIRSIWNNIYILKREKPKKLFLFFALILLFFLCIWFSSKREFQKSISLEGIYHCDKKCTLTSTLPLSIAKKLKEQKELQINEKKYPITIKEFGQISTIETMNISVQKVVFDIPKLQYYERQTIEFQLLLEKESLLKSIWRAWKGGDENAKSE